MKTLRTLSVVLLTLVTLVSCSKDDAMIGPSRKVTVETENLNVKMIATQEINSNLVTLNVTSDAVGYARNVRFFSKEHSTNGVDRLILIAKDQTEGSYMFKIKEGNLALEKLVIYEVVEAK